MLGISYTRLVMLCEGLSSQTVTGGCALIKFLLDDIASHDTILQFSSVVLQVRIFCYFGILNDGFYRPHKRCREYSLCVRLAFAVASHQISVIWQYCDNKLDKRCQAYPRHCSHRAQRFWGSLDWHSIQGEREHRQRRCFLLRYISIQGQTLWLLCTSAWRVLYYKIYKLDLCDQCRL